MSWLEDVRRIADEMDEWEERTGVLFDDIRFTRRLITKARRMPSLAKAHHDPEIMRAVLDSYLSVLDPDIADVIERNITEMMEEERHAES
jgi:hypothetical protein